MKGPFYPYIMEKITKGSRCNFIFSCWFFFFFVNAEIIRGVLDFLLWLINQRTVGVWDAFTTLWWCVQCILMAKYVVPLYHQKRCLALFLMVQRVVVVDGWLFADDRFFFFFIPAFLSLLAKVHTCPLFFSFLNFSP